MTLLTCRFLALALRVLSLTLCSPARIRDALSQLARMTIVTILTRYIRRGRYLIRVTLLFISTHSRVRVRWHRWIATRQYEYEQPSLGWLKRQTAANATESGRGTGVRMCERATQLLIIRWFYSFGNQ